MKINFDFTAADKRIKAMNAIGQPPLLGISDCYFHYLTEAHIPFSRLHDVGGWYGGYMFVDIPNLFRDFSADENDPASYDFAFTDILMKGLMDAKCMPYFRLGVTIENNAEIRAYRLDPPADFGKWARICEHIIRHYNEGWADGFQYGIEYWEIWNEADACPQCPGTCVNEMWWGTMQQFFDLYEITSKHLKQCFGDRIKVGGYAATCGFSIPDEEYVPDPARDVAFYAHHNEEYRLDWFIKFLEFVSKTNSPLDFFSWHSYQSVHQTMELADFIDTQLTRFGFNNTESHLNEWNNNPDKMNRASSLSASNAAAMMIAMQTKRADVLCYYDGRLSVDIYGGLFNPLTREPFATYYSLKAFGELLMLGYQAGEAIVNVNGIYALASHDGNGNYGLMITNNGESEMSIETELDGMTVQLIDEEHMMTDTDFDSKKFTLGAKQTVYLKN